MNMEAIGGLANIRADVEDSEVWEAPVLLDDEQEALLRWPGSADDADGSAIGRILATSLGTADTHTGEDGRWVRLSVGDTTLTWTSTIWPDGESPMVGYLLMSAPRLDLISIGTEGQLGPGPIIYSDPHLAGPEAPDQSGPWAEFFILPGYEGTHTWDGITFARAWHGLGERWLLVTDEIDVSSGTVQITITPAGGELVTIGASVLVSPVLREIVVPEIGSELDGETIYAIELREVVRAFAEFDEDDRVDVVPALNFFISAGALLNYLLTSPAHLALGNDDVDIGSVLGDGADPPWVRRWGLPDAEPGDEVSYEAIVNGVLRASRSALAMVTGPDGKCRVTRIPVGTERPDRVSVEIGAGDWSAGSVPRWGTDDRLVNRLTVRAALGDVSEEGDRSEIDWTYQEQFESLTSQRMFEEVAAEEIDLYAALDVDRDDPGIVGFGRQVLAAYEAPRRQWTGEVGTYLGVRAHLAATVRVTSRFLRGYDGQPADGDLAVVTERRLDLWGEGVELTMAHLGRLSTGWNAACRVDSVVNETTVTVEPNRYSSPLYPTADGSPWRDWMAFGDGDVVRCLPRLDVDAGGNRTVLSVDATGKFTFTAPHGLAVGDIITPPAYNSASAFAKVYAYLADANGTLGPDSEPGGRYS